MDIVIITTFHRPEYLSLCLEYLAKADGAHEGKEYWLFQDMRPEDEHRNKMQLDWTREVIEKSPVPLRVIRRAPHTFPGNSYNTLEAYKEAYESSARFVHLVEDDCLVSSDYFRWHESIQEKEKGLLCSVGYRCIRNSAARKDISDPAAYFLSGKDYASVGVCWRREELGPIVEHARPEYYAESQIYLDNRFPQDIYSGWFSEQDGCIMRVLHERKKNVAWAYAPRTFHFGGYGYHRFGKRPDGQLADKVRTLRSWIHDGALLKQMFPDFGDMEPMSEDLNYEWSSEELHCVQRFE